MIHLIKETTKPLIQLTHPEEQTRSLTKLTQRNLVLSTNDKNSMILQSLYLILSHNSILQTRKTLRPRDYNLSRLTQ